MSIESSERALDILRVWLVVFTSGVAFGLVLEYKTPLLLIFKGLIKLIRFKANPVERCALRKMCWHFLGALLVTGGVLGEFWIEYKQYGAESELTRASAAARDKLNSETAAARDAAGKAIERAAKANGETAELLKIVAPRDLSEAQQNSIRAALSRVKGKLVFIRSYPGDAEAARLIVEIKNSLEPVIHVEDRTGEMIGEMAPSGFLYGIRIVPAQNERPFAEMLIRALGDKDKGNLAVEPISSFGGGISPTDIEVGTKPATGVQMSAQRTLETDIATFKSALGPRRLSEKDKQRLSDAVAKYSGLSVDIFVLQQADRPSIDEGLLLSHDIRDALSKRMNVGEYFAHDCQDWPLVGVFVEAIQDLSPDRFAAGDILGTLKSVVSTVPIIPPLDAKLPCNAISGGPIRPDGWANIRIIIGKRPTPILP